MHHGRPLFAKQPDELGVCAAATTYSGRMLKGALAASVTPLRDGGDAPDEDPFGPLVDFYVDGALKGTATVAP